MNAIHISDYYRKYGCKAFEVCCLFAFESETCRKSKLFQEKTHCAASKYIYSCFENVIYSVVS